MYCMSFRRLYDVERLRRSYFALQREAAPGVDGETWRYHGDRLEVHFQHLAEPLDAHIQASLMLPTTDGL